MLDFDGLIVGPCMDVFGEPVAYYGTSTVATPLTIQGVYDEAYLPLAPFGGGQAGLGPIGMGAMPNITASMPVLGVRLADFPAAPAQGDLLLIRGQHFLVREVQPDGHGWAKLLLNESYGGANQMPTMLPGSSSFATTIVGDGVTQSFTIPHPLGTTDVVVQVRDPLDRNALVPGVDSLAPDPGTVVVELSAPLAPGVPLRIIVSR